MIASSVIVTKKMIGPSVVVVENVIGSSILMKGKSLYIWIAELIQENDRIRNKKP